jgi:hypothetical protein
MIDRAGAGQTEHRRMRQENRSFAALQEQHRHVVGLKMLAALHQRGEIVFVCKLDADRCQGSPVPFLILGSSVIFCLCRSSISRLYSYWP